MQNNNKNLDPELQTLLSIDLLKVLSIVGIEEDNLDSILKEHTVLSWMYFFETDGKDLPEEDLKMIEVKTQEGDFEEVDNFFNEKFPDFKVAIIKNSLLAKKFIIERELEEVLDKLASLEQKEPFKNMLNSAQANNWREFIYYLNKNERNN